MSDGDGDSQGTQSKSLRLLSDGAEDAYHIVTFLGSDGEVFAEQYVKDGEIPILPDQPVKDKHCFVGWEPDVTTAVITDTTYTPVFEAVKEYKVTITYVAEDGTDLGIDALELSYLDGEVFSQEFVSPIPENGAYVPEENLVTITNEMLTQPELTIVVNYKKAQTQYTELHYFEALEGEDDVVKKTVGTFVGVQIDVQPISPIREGFVVDSKSDPVEIEAGKEHTVEVHYKRKVNEIAFECLGGKALESVSGKFESEIQMPKPERVGYEFKGWHTTEACIDEDPIMDGETMTIPAVDKTVYYAKWEPILVEYTVVYMIEKQGLGHEPSADDIRLGDFMASPITKTRKAIPGTKVTAIEEDILFEGMTAYAVHGDENIYAKDVKIASYLAADTVTVKADGSTTLNVYFKRDHFTYVFDGFNSFKRYGDEGDHLNPDEAVHLYFKYNNDPSGVEGTYEEDETGCYYSEIILNNIHYGETVTDRWPDILVGEFYIKDTDGNFVTLSDANLQVSVGTTEGSFVFDGWRGVMNSSDLQENVINTTAYKGAKITGRMLCNFNRDGETENKWRGCLMVKLYMAKMLAITEEIVIPADAPRNTTGAPIEVDISEYSDYTTISEDNQSQLFKDWKRDSKSVLIEESAFDPNDGYWLNAGYAGVKSLPHTYGWWVSKITGFEYDWKKTENTYGAYSGSAANPYDAHYVTVCLCSRSNCGYSRTYTDGKGLVTDDHEIRLMPFLYNRVDYKFNFIPVLGNESMAVEYMVPYEADLSWWEPVLTDEQKIVQIDDVKYTFAGWYYDEEYKDPVDWENDRMPAEGFSVYAKWEPGIIDITFDLNYEGAPEAITYAMDAGSYMEDQEGFSAVPERKGYKFLGWYYDKEAQADNGFDTEQKIGDSLDGTIVYAAWEKITTGYTVRYLLEGTQTVVLHEQKVESGLEPGQEVKEEFVRIPGYRVDKLEASIILTEDEAKNQIIFYYAKLNEVEYQVIHRFLDIEGNLIIDDNGNPIQIEEEPVKTTDERIIKYAGHKDIEEEFFPTVIVDSLMLTSDSENNKLYFYYQLYPTAKYIVHHYYQDNLDQKEYTEYPEDEEVKAESRAIRKGYSYIAKREIKNGYDIKKVFIESEETTTRRDLYLTPDIDQMGKEIHVHMYYSLIPTTVTVTKVWDDETVAAMVRPEEIEVQLTVNGEEYGETVILSDTNSWQYTWTNLLGFKNAGQEDAKEIEYSVNEIVPNGYKLVSTVKTGSVTTGYQVVLTNRPMDTEKHAKVKSWEDRTYDITISASAAEGTGAFTNVTIKDYIDSRFEVIEPLDGTIGTDDGGTYVIWTNQTVESLNGTIPGWTRTITVKAKDEYIGGNDVTTNGEGSVITVDGKTFILDRPTVNVKVDFNVSKDEHWIYKGNVIGDLFSDHVIQQITLADLARYTIISDVEITEVTWYEDIECTVETTVDQIRQTATDAVYYAKVTVTPKQDGNNSLENTTDAKGVAHKVEEISKLGTYTVHLVKGELQIAKNLEQVSSEDQTFTFNVTKDGREFEMIDVKVPAGRLSAVYVPANGEENVLTDLEEGIYVVTEVFAENADFQLKEVTVDGNSTNCYSESDDVSATFHMGYDENDAPIIVNGKLQASAYTTQTDVASGKEVITVTKGVQGIVSYTNAETHTWKIVKVGSDIQNPGNQRYLVDAKFKLEQQGGSEQTESYYGKTETDGLIKWYLDDSYAESKAVERIPNGSYTLTEIEAPIGYSLSDEIWTLLIRNGKVTATSGSGSNITSTSETTDGQTVVTFYFNNKLLYSLPSTGGEGIYRYMLGGILLLMAGALMIYNKRNKVLMD